MTAAPSPRTWVNGEIPGYDTINEEIYSTLAFLLQPPMCKLRQTTAQTLSNTTFTAITWQTEDADQFNWHNPTNPSRMTPTFPGWYRGWFSVPFSTSTAGTYRLSHAQRVSGTGTATRSRRDLKPSPDALTVRSAGVPFWLPVNGSTDYIEIVAYQDTGSSMTLPVSTALQAEVFLRWWMPL